MEARMHDLAAEGPLVALKDLPKLALFGPRRGGGRMAIRTGFRWAGRGLSGVVLQTILQGGRRYTTVLALRRFFADVDAARTRKRTALVGFAPLERGESSDAVATELDHLGI